MWTDNSLTIIEDDAPYTAPDGGTYPWQFPKASVPGLMPITPTERPDDMPAAYTVDGQPRGGIMIEAFNGREWRVEMVDGVPTQVWHTVPRPEMTLAEAQAVKVSTLTAACAASISAGVVHAALGAAHTYPMGDKDQTNLLGRVAQAQMDATGTFNLWCADQSGVWAKRPHTAAQTIAVGLAAAAWVQANSDRLSGEDGLGGLLKVVDEAQTVTEVAAVMW